MDGIYSVLNVPTGHLKIVASLENLFKKEDFNPKSNAQIIVFSLKLDMHLVAISKEPLYPLPSLSCVMLLLSWKQTLELLCYTV